MVANADLGSVTYDQPLAAGSSGQTLRLEVSHSLNQEQSELTGEKERYWQLAHLAIRARATIRVGEQLTGR